jgi:hypothetical protein
MPIEKKVLEKIEPIGQTREQTKTSFSSADAVEGTIIRRKHMKQYLVLGAVAALVVGSLMADDTMKPTTVQKKTVKTSAGSTVDRELEVRIGPRVSFLTGGVRIGKTGSEFDIWDDAGLDEPSAGVQFNVDWQPINRWHADFGMTYDNYDHSGNTKKNITAGDDTLVSGAALSADITALTFEATIGYDVVKTKELRVKPYIGGKGAYADGTAGFTGAVLNSAGVLVDANRTKTANVDTGYGMALGGIDTRYYVVPVDSRWYVGADIGATGWENWYLLTGEAYTGWDFTQNWGVRAGYAYDYFNRENDVKSSFQDPLLGAVYVQAVWGF